MIISRASRKRSREPAVQVRDELARVTGELDGCKASEKEQHDKCLLLEFVRMRSSPSWLS